MRPLSNQSPSTFLPHGVAAPADAADGQRRRGRQRDDDQRDERAALTTGCHV